MADLLEVLPPRWRQDRMLVGYRTRWDAVEVLGDDDGVLLVAGTDRPLLWGRGDAAAVNALLARHARAARWLNLPRDCAPSDETLARLELVPFSTWDWLSLDTPPPAVPGEDRVRRLDVDAEADAIRACLRVANPGTSAGPQAPGELGWWGMDDEHGALGGVVGVVERSGPGEDSSWHVHGLGVLPTLRGRGAGSALTAAVVREAFSAGAPWVSLAMYADNDTARRLYRRLGFRTDVELTSYSPAGADRPPR